MNNIKCIIRKNLKTQNNEHLIYLRYTYNRRYILLRTDVYTTYNNWNKGVGRVRKSINYELKNIVLEQKEIELEKVVLELMSKKIEPTLLDVKIKYYNNKNKFQDVKTEPRKHNEKMFLKDFKDFIEYKENLGTISKETIKTYNTTLNKLTKFHEDTSYLLHYNTINNEFYYMFLRYLRKNGLYDNSVDKHIKNLKLFMYYSLSKEKHNNNVFQSFKRTRTKTDFVVLELDELRKLYYDYKPNGKLKEVRDAFIFGCTTGLRFSDLTKITSGNFVITRDPVSSKINEDASYSYIRIPVKKTSENLIVPLNHFICRMIEEYDIENTSEITFLNHNLQLFNRQIKEVCRNAGLTSISKVSKKKNKVLIPVEKPKCDFVSSHTMRRTFISILSSMTSVTNIQAVSGHKDINVLTNYIKRNERELNTIRGCFNDNVFNTSDPNAVRITKIETKRN